MAVVGISRSETFEYVLDSDPCKKRVELDVPRIEDGQKITHDEVIEEGATVFTFGVLDVFLLGLIYDQSTLVTRNDEDHQIGVVNAERILLRSAEVNFPTWRASVIRCWRERGLWVWAAGRGGAVVVPAAAA